MADLASWRVGPASGPKCNRLAWRSVGGSDDMLAGPRD